MSIALILFFAVLLIAAFVMIPANVLASSLRTFIPASLIVAGGAAMLLKQAGIGSMLLFAGLALWRRMRGVGTFGGASQQGPQVSSVRSAALEMELDHDSGEMEGVILVGSFEGRVLGELNEDELRHFRSEIEEDGESLALLDAYLDRRFAGGAEDAEADAGARQAGTSGAGTMGEKEAYEVLGLAIGADAAAIRKAHRRLMKTAHPDSGGSTFLAAKINEAKDVLLRSHS